VRRGDEGMERECGSGAVRRVSQRERVGVRVGFEWWRLGLAARHHQI
jgi:hypothetical protein